MAKRQSTYRVSPYTSVKMDELVTMTGMTKTEIIGRGIDLLFSEVVKDEEHGDTATLMARASDKMIRLGFNQKQMDFIFNDWSEGDDHLRWLINATKGDIIDWAEATDWGKNPDAEESNDQD